MLFYSQSQLDTDKQAQRVEATNYHLLNTKGTLYWIHRPTDTNPIKQGYIGVSEDFKNRVKQHEKDYSKYLKARGESPEFVIEVLLEGRLLDIVKAEYDYRPMMGIGDNYAAGGSWLHGANASEKIWSKWAEEANASMGQLKLVI